MLRKEITLFKKSGDISKTWDKKLVPASITRAHKLEQDATELINKESANPLLTCCDNLASETLKWYLKCKK